MGLVLNKETIIFIEETVFLVEGFFEELKQLIEQKITNNKLEIKIIIDSNIDNSINNLKTNLFNKQAYLLDGTIDILKYYNLCVEVETKSYLDISEIIKIFEKTKEADCYVITQKENIFNSFINNNLPNKVKYLKYTDKQFIPWEIKQEKLNAFYIENDDYIPKINTKDISYVYSPKYGYLKLDLTTEKSGGEGSVYQTYNKFMAKIYNEDSITYINYKKLSLMLETNVFNKYICWPKDLLYIDNNFVGYLMDNVEDAVLLLTLRLKNFSNYTHLDRFVLCYNLLKNIKYLHDRNILIGDLKPDNILVKSPNEVYLIDCGCYQIEDYACPVCHPEYTKREFKKDQLKKELRTLSDEYYPINKLAFEILIRKNHTYQPGNQDIENQDKNQFHYPLNVNNITPTTEDMAIWCFLTQPMREYFYYYFKEGRITDLETWCNELKLFIEYMQSQI